MNCELSKIKAMLIEASIQLWDAHLGMNSLQKGTGLFAVNRNLDIAQHSAE